MGKQSDLYYAGATDGFLLRDASSTCMEIKENISNYDSNFNTKTQFCYFMPSGAVSPGPYYTGTCSPQTGTVTKYNSFGTDATLGVADFKNEYQSTPYIWGT